MKVHLALPVHDINATAEFYAQLFRSPPSKQKSDYVKFEPEHLALNISFYASDSADLNTSQHLGLQLLSLEELEVEHERLHSAGLIQKERETSVCCYARQDKFWVKDPQGYQWELYVRLEDTQNKMDVSTTCCGSSSSRNKEGAQPACC